MRMPETIERLYLDFDGFYASVEQLADRKLRGRPVGVVPHENLANTSIIAVSREAKMAGVANVMRLDEARRICPDLVLVPQKPDLYRRAHHALISEIETVLPVDTIKSIDEMTCRLDEAGRAEPLALAARVKAAIRENIGAAITCSIGMAANRQLAKMACKAGKWTDKRYGDGLTIWHPADMPEPLLAVKMEDIPGIGERMATRLRRIGIQTTAELYKLQPKHMRKIWGNVTGERLWYALHGYDIQAEPSSRGMFGHGRVLPPELRTIPGAEGMARMLLVKAARRLRRENYYAAGVWLWFNTRHGQWSRKRRLPIVNDDQALRGGLDALWAAARRDHPRGVTIHQVGVALLDLSPAGERQLDLLLNDDAERRRWEKISGVMDTLNGRHAQTLLHVGEWSPPEGGHLGGKISYTRIPTAEDFW